MTNSQQAVYEYQGIMNLIHNIQNRYSRSNWGIRGYGSGARYLRQLTNRLLNSSKEEYLREELGYYNDNPYKFNIYNVSINTLYLRVAVTPEYHAHKRGQYYVYRTIPISYLTKIFYKEVIELKKEKLEQLMIHKKRLNQELHELNKEIFELNESLESYR